MNRYRVLLPVVVQLPDGRYEQGDEFDHEFTAEDETRNLHDGLLEIVPRTYRVIGGSDVHETPPGSTFVAALTVGVEGLLFQGGHIERVDEAPVAPAKPAEKPIKKAAETV